MVTTRGGYRMAGSRLALCQTLSIECPSSIFFWHVYFAILVRFSLSFLFVFFFCSHWSFLVDVPLISFCPADHVPDWQRRIVLGMVEARSVNVKEPKNNICIYGQPTHSFHSQVEYGTYSIYDVVVFFTLIDRASTIPSNIRGCQSVTWSAGQRKM